LKERYYAKDAKLRYEILYQQNGCKYQSTYYDRVFDNVIEIYPASSTGKEEKLRAEFLMSLV
jgi:hypothetical protein